MIKAEAFSRLIDLDFKVQESSKRREEELTKIEKHYQLKKQEIIQEYSRKMQEESEQAARQIINQGEEETEAIKNRTKRQLEQMEINFMKYKDQIANELLERIFDIKRENHG